MKKAEIAGIVIGVLLCIIGLIIGLSVGLTTESTKDEIILSGSVERTVEDTSSNEIPQAMITNDNIINKHNSNICLIYDPSNYLNIDDSIIAILLENLGLNTTCFFDNTCLQNNNCEIDMNVCKNGYAIKNIMNGKTISIFIAKRGPNSISNESVKNFIKRLNQIYNDKVVFISIQSMEEYTSFALYLIDFTTFINYPNKPDNYNLFYNIPGSDPLFIYGGKRSYVEKMVKKCDDVFRDVPIVVG